MADAFQLFLSGQQRPSTSRRPSFDAATSSPMERAQQAAFMEGATEQDPVRGQAELVASPDESWMPRAVPGTLGEEFGAAVQAGAIGLQADLEFFKGLTNTIVGDEKAAAANIRNARLAEEDAAAPLEGLETFEQFLEQPTFGGFVSQATRGFGQVVPSAILSIASAGTGALTAAVGRGVLNQVNRQAAKRIIKDSVDRTIQGVADPAEQQIAELAYGSLRQAATRGAIGGGFAAEFAPMSGSNLSEALESGQPLDRGTAFRAAAVGVPQAAIGVGSEYALLKLIGEQATKRAAVEGGIFANFAKRISASGLRGGAIEAGTETLQEGISVANRADLDPLFTAEDASLRLAESAFAGFFGGAAPGAAGGALGATGDAISRIPQGARDVAGGVADKASSIFSKARDMLNTAREQRVNDQINREQFGDIFSAGTTPEPERDIDAQLRAMLDPTSGKNAVWVAGAPTKIKARPNGITNLMIGGEMAYASFIPGRGTIVSTDLNLVNEVVAAGASDKALQVALGYSAVKDAANPGDLVVQVFDRDGRVVSEEATTRDNLPAAFQAASKLMPEGGRVEQTTVEKALEDRKRRFEAEQSVDIREMDTQDEQDGTEDQTDVDIFGQGSQIIEPERKVLGTYAKKKNLAAVFDNTESARAEYEKVFGETDWNSLRFASMSEQMLIAAVKRQKANPYSAVIIEDAPDGKFRLVEEDFGQDEKFRFEKVVKDKETGVETTQTLMLNLQEYLVESIRRASRVSGNLLSGGKERTAGAAPGNPTLRRDANRVTIVSPSGKTAKVALWDLVNSGRGLIFGRGESMLGTTDRQGQVTSNPRAAARNGFFSLLADLALSGYDVQVDGQSITKEIPASVTGVTAWLDRGRPVSLADLISQPQSAPPTQTAAQGALEEQVFALLDVPGALNERGEPDLEYLSEQLGLDLQTVSDVFDRLGLRQRRGQIIRNLGIDEDLVDTITTVFYAVESWKRQQEQTDTQGGIENDQIRISKSDIRDGELTTPMNIDTGRAAIDLRQASAPTTVVPSKPSGNIERTPVSNSIDSMVRGVINDLLDTLKLKIAPRIYTLADLTALSAEQLAAEFTDAKVLQAVKDTIEEFRTKPSKLGQHITAPTGEKVIVYRPTDNKLQDALTVAHEIGHSLYKEERDKALTNKALRPRLINAYKNSSSFKQLSEKYGFDRGFEEWFSDQVSLWASARYKNRARKNLVDKFFDEFVGKLKRMYNALTKSVRNRLKDGVSQDFESFMDAVIEARRTEVNQNGLGFTEKAFVYEIDEFAAELSSSQAAPGGGQPPGSRPPRPLQEFLYANRNNFALKKFLGLALTADNILRMYAGDKIADMFYVRAQDPTSKGRTGFAVQSPDTFRDYTNKVQKEIGSLDDPEVINGFNEAASDAPTDQLSGKARQIREFLENFYSDYIVPSKTKIGFRKNFFPRVLNLITIADNPQPFIDLILSRDPTADAAKVRKAVQGIVTLQQSITNAADIQVDPLNPSSNVTEALELTKNLSMADLAPYLVEPKVAFMQYLRSAVKRVEFDRATKDDQGNDQLKPLLDALNPEDREVALGVINTYMGYRAPLNPVWRKLNSWAQFIQAVALLPFAALASLTDLAGPVIASREFGAITVGLKEIIATIKNRDEAAQFARDIGVATQESVANAWLTEADADYMDPLARKASDVWFNITGLNWFTNFSREFSARMGVQFMIKHARNEFNNPNSARYLSELGITREEVLAWVDGGRKLSTPEGKKVTQALQRFVASSILRPNAAERPPWASDPNYALIWQLKGYFYSYGKVILGGMFTEIETRLSNQQVGTPWSRIGSAAGLLALTAVATMPLAMMGMELREYAKFGLAAVLPFVEADQRYFKTDRMDWPEYLGAAFEKSNFSGPFALLGMASQSSLYGDSPLFTLLGPTAETVDVALQNGWRVDRTLKDRLLPIYNQLYL